MLGVPRHPAGARSAAGASNPRHALDSSLVNGCTGFLVLGTPCSCVITGGEALYADLGHFGRQPIRRAWYTFVLPALLLNYFGQGALLLADPAPIGNIRSSSWRRPGRCYPLVVLATRGHRASPRRP